MTSSLRPSGERKMAPKPILLRSLREDVMSKALEYIKAALQIAFGVIVLAIILLNFHGLNLASQKFLETASVSKIQLPGVEIDMDAAGVDQALSSAGVN